MALNYVSTSDPKKAAQNSRDMAQQEGDQLNQQFKDQGDQASGFANNYGNFLDPIEQQMAAGQGGYNPDEEAAIRDQGGLSQIGGELGSNYLTPEEAAGMRGDTSSYANYFDPGAMHDQLAGAQGVQDTAVGNLKSGLGNAIRPNDLRQSQSYADAMHDQVNANQGNVRGTLSGEKSAVRGAIDPAALKQDAGAAQTEVMTPEQEREMVTAAGISAGARNQAAVGSLQRSALAAGSSPQGVAAYRARMNEETAAQAGDAMTEARVQAQQARAGEALSSEQQRLGAQSNLTNVQTGTELAMGQQETSAEQQLGQQALSQANTEEANRQAAEQYLTGAEMQAATTGGEAELQNSQQKTSQQQQQNQYSTTTGTNITEAQDQANAARAAQIAQNRQGVSAANQKTQLDLSNTGSGRAATVANTRVGQQNTGLQLQQGQEQQQNQNSQAAYQRELGTYATKVGGVNQATATSEQANQNPGLFDKIAGAATGIAGAAAGFLADGGIATSPTLAVVGEHGPEKIVPMGSPYRARMTQMKPPAPKRRAPMRYGQEVA